MSSFPNRCQHIKINGTQCGSPALRRNRFCYFHKRHHEERIKLNLERAQNDRAKKDHARRHIAINLPVLEDANAIQVALMQIMRLLIAGQIEGTTAGLLLYALQTASANLQRTRFEPYRNDVVIDPADVGDTPLGSSIWEDSDFENEQEEDEPEEEEHETPKTPAQVRAQIREQIRQAFAPAPTPAATNGNGQHTP